jgi:HPt (histidine-containing phosphotransfer) domain-containing protein
MAADAQTALAAALDRMWVQFLPQMHERVGVLENAARDFARGALAVERQQEAQAAAHKLAGVLGTFGLTQGTVLARELEIVYSRLDAQDPQLAERLASSAAELRRIIATRK